MKGQIIKGIQFQELPYAEMKFVLSKSQPKGYVFTIEAIVCLLAFVYFISTEPVFEKVDLNDEILFLQVQDMTEVCSNLKVVCVKEKACPNATIERDYVSITVTLASDSKG